jgi:hypothetical protein
MALLCSLDLPVDIAPGPAEILVIIQPQTKTLVPSQLTVADLGRYPIKAATVRAKLASFVKDWDDPRLDVYNEL